VTNLVISTHLGWTSFNHHHWKRNAECGKLFFYS